MTTRLAARARVACVCSGLAMVVGCGQESESAIDTRLTLVPVTASPSATLEQVGYARALADIHARADGAEGDEIAAVLQAGLAVPVPEDFPQALVLRLDLATRLAEFWHHERGQPMLALDLLQPMLRPDRPLPLDAATARALVAFGDAAAARGAEELAAGSYGRALRVLSSLREELER